MKKFFLLYAFIATNSLIYASAAEASAPDNEYGNLVLKSKKHGTNVTIFFSPYGVSCSHQSLSKDTPPICQNCQNFIGDAKTLQEAYAYRKERKRQKTQDFWKEFDPSKKYCENPTSGPLQPKTIS